MIDNGLTLPRLALGLAKSTRLSKRIIFPLKYAYIPEFAAEGLAFRTSA
jgi:hypothetical protein